MRATAGKGLFNVVDLYDSGTGRWSTAQLSQARCYLSATSVGTVAIFAGGQGSELIMIVFVYCGSVDCGCAMRCGNICVCV
jgi:hypothetical protein